MTLEMARKFLGWSTVINFVVLAVWFLGLLIAHDTVHRIHGKWFRLQRETFDTIHYAGMAGFKLCVFVFNLVPYLVLRLWF
jgi:hypothetical protein